uniref:Ribosomal protein L34 n=1 Tax=Kuetzingia canaliculata TaxID=228262 RepID=A0A1Z1MNU6_KUECA|nr:ribosomal protein L34 [Kuetzingia canaliculata]ARW67767.1 ribosomal protein L34 [Kuetzingia canaliculata]
MHTGTKKKKMRKLGFLIRMKTHHGRKIINSKRHKKRSKIN